MLAHYLLDYRNSLLYITFLYLRVHFLSFQQIFSSNGDRTTTTYPLAQKRKKEKKEKKKKEKTLHDIGEPLAFR